MIQAALNEVGIDFPHPGEVIEPGPYSFRIAAPADAKEVSISIDDEGWRSCRRDDGHWWFDWPGQEAGQGAGDHVAVTRVIEGNGTLLVTQPRLFRVRPR